jgi:hypothetical protein
MNKKMNKKIIYLTLVSEKIASIASMAYLESFTGALIDALLLR